MYPAYRTQKGGIDMLRPDRKIRGVTFLYPARLNAQEVGHLARTYHMQRDGRPYRFLQHLLKARGQVLTFRNDQAGLEDFQIACGGLEYLNNLFRKNRLQLYVVQRRTRTAHQGVLLQCRLWRVERKTKTT